METSKKVQRQESKLKKAKAFLELVGQSQSESPESLATTTDTIDLHRSRSRSNTAIKNEELMEKRNEDRQTESKKTEDLPSEEVFLEMKRIIRERNKQAMQRPKIFLTLENLNPYRLSNSESAGDDILPPLYVLDLQHLLVYALQGNVASFKPRWCKLARVTKVSSVVFLCMDGVGYEDFLNDKDSFHWISQSFHSHIEMVCPDQYNISVDDEIMSVPLSVSQLKKVNQKVSADVKRQVAIKLKPHKIGEKVSRLCLLLSSHQMMTEGYPMPIVTKRRQYRDFVFSKDHYTEVTPSSPLYGLDCEMCFTTAKENELTRVSIISESGEVVYDSLVKPRNRIINYLTRFSGITKEMMEPVGTVIEDVQRDIKELLPPDAILCGQSLNSDLNALKMFHPYVIDTSIIYNMSGNRSIKAGLRKLSSFFLSRNIQNNAAGHCSAEDAKATLDLVKLKLNKGLEFGDATISGVYFPNIETYFLGETNGKQATAENIEEENSDEKVTMSFKLEHQLASDFLASNKAAKRPHSSTNSIGSDSDEDTSSCNSIGNKCKRSKLSETDIEKTVDLSSHHDKSSISANRVEPSDVKWTDAQQTAIFSQKNSVHVSRSFFKLVYEAGRSGCFIGRSRLTSKYKGEPIEMITTSNDSEARKCAKAMVQTKEFVWAYFSEYKEEQNSGQLTDEAKQKLRRKLDHRVRSVVKKVKENALVVLLLTGRKEDDGINNAGVFVKIT